MSRDHKKRVKRARRKARFKRQDAQKKASK